MPFSPSAFAGMRARLGLRQQVVLLMSAVLALAMVAVYYVSSDRLTKSALLTAQRWANELARTAASAGAEPMALKDYGALEATLRDIVALPGVLRIDVVEPEGNPLLSLYTPHKAANAADPGGAPGEVRVKYRARDLPATMPGLRGAYLSRIDGEEVLQAWAPLKEGLDLGSVVVTFSQKDQRAGLQRMQFESLLAIAAIGAFTIAVCYLFLAYSLAPLQRLAEFSRDLSARPGRRLEQVSGSREVAGLTGALNDASARLRQQLDELRASEAQTQSALNIVAERSARLNAVFGLSPDGFAVFDRDGRMVFSNAALAGMTNWPEMASSDALSLEDFDRRFATLCDPAQAYASLRASTEGDACATLTLLLPERRVLTRALRRNLGGQGESILYMRDITHETEVDRMKSEFLASAAHELRTPMTSIFGFAELMLHRTMTPEKQRDLIETIHKQSDLLVGMVNELLDLARIEARRGKDFKPAPQTLGALVTETVDGLILRGDARGVQREMIHSDAVVRLDRDKTRQALTNVLSNAFKFSPAGGDVTVRTLTRQHGGAPQVGLAVSDRGIGMTPEQRARVFERFYRADTSGSIPGTGLGMSLVKEIVELQGGEVEVQSRIGEGTCVTLWFPLYSAVAVSRSGAALPDAAGTEPMLPPGGEAPA